MDIEKQREVVRLWNRMRRVEGPLAEEIRIQILACFSDQPAEGCKPARANGNFRPMRRETAANVPA